MTKCDYCGKKIGIMALWFTWIDKKNDIVVHDKCIEEYKKKHPEQIKQIDEIHPKCPKCGRHYYSKKQFHVINYSGQDLLVCPVCWKTKENKGNNKTTE